MLKGDKEKTHLQQLLMFSISSISILIWIYVTIISINLEPIADEVCVLGEWRENSLLPPHHNSPRVFASLFTWLLAPIWKIEYALGFVVIIIISAIFIYKIFSQCVQYLYMKNASIKSKIIFTIIVTPWILFALPPNKSALFDSIFWFGGSWHLIGALIVSYTVLLILTQERSRNSVYLWIFIASFWSETTACVIFIVLFLNLRTNKKYLKALVFPSAGLVLHLVANLNSQRISDVQNDVLRNNLNIFKGSIKMLSEYSLNSAFIAIILSTVFLPHSSEHRNLPTRRIMWLLLLTTSGMVSVYLVGYPTWRSSSLIGVLFFTLLIMLLGRKFKNTYSLLIQITITIILGINATANLKSIETVSIERSNWWSSVVASNKTLSPFIFNGKSPEFLQADYGSSEWIDSCFENFKANRAR